MSVAAQHAEIELADDAAVAPVAILKGRSHHEVALLGISATEAAKGMSIWSIIVFSALFAAGMSLIDTTDGVLMLGAYNWAFAKPIRKLYYNLTITFVSVAVACLVGGIEVLGLIGGRLNLSGWFWDGLGVLNDNFNGQGFVIVSVFIAA